MINEGQIVGRNYKIISKLGAGGMGLVYKALDINLNREVAIKFLAPDQAQNEDIVKRFINEGRILATINHPSVVTVYASDFDPNINSHFLVMEYIDGKSIDSYKYRYQTEKELLYKHFIDILDGIKACHNKGIIHRDIKPSNILVTKEEEKIKIVDFGIAKTAEKQTKTGIAMGTPHYMSPEQCLGKKEITYKSDIYSIGIMLWQFVVGKMPFEANENATDPAIAIALMHLNEPPPVEQLNEVLISEDLKNILLKMLSKNPDERPEIMEIIDHLRNEMLFSKKSSSFKDTQSEFITLKNTHPIMEIETTSNQMTINTNRKITEISNYYKELENNIKILNKTEEGSYYTIYEAYPSNLPYKCNLVVFKPILSNENEFLKQFISETSKFCKLSNNYFLHILDFGIDINSNLAFLAYEKLNAKSLLEFYNILKNLPNKILRVLEIIVQILEAIKFCHKNSIAHRKITPNNIFVDEPEVKIKIYPPMFGFGFANNNQELKKNIYQNLLELQYLSPEHFNSQELSYKSDIYSLGTIIWELIFGIPPYAVNQELVNEEKVKKDIIHKHLEATIPFQSCVLDPAFSKLFPIVREMLQKLPNLRPDVDEVYKHVKLVYDELHDINNQKSYGNKTLIVKNISSTNITDQVHSSFSSIKTTNEEFESQLTQEISKAACDSKAGLIDINKANEASNNLDKTLIKGSSIPTTTPEIISNQNHNNSLAINNKMILFLFICLIAITLTTYYYLLDRKHSAQNEYKESLQPLSTTQILSNSVNSLTNSETISHLEMKNMSDETNAKLASDMLNNILIDNVNKYDEFAYISTSTQNYDQFINVITSDSLVSENYQYPQTKLTHVSETIENIVAKSDFDVSTITSNISSASISSIGFPPASKSDFLNDKIVKSEKVKLALLNELKNNKQSFLYDKYCQKILDLYTELELLEEKVQLQEIQKEIEKTLLETIEKTTSESDLLRLASFSRKIFKEENVVLLIEKKLKNLKEEQRQKEIIYYKNIIEKFKPGNPVEEVNKAFDKLKKLDLQEYEITHLKDKLAAKLEKEIRDSIQRNHKHSENILNEVVKIKFISNLPIWSEIRNEIYKFKEMEKEKEKENIVINTTKVTASASLTNNISTSSTIKIMTEPHQSSIDKEKFSDTKLDSNFFVKNEIEIYPDSKPTLEEAIKNAKPNAKIILHPGEYRGSFTVEKNVTIISSNNNAESVKITNNDKFPVFVLTNKATLQNITIHYTGTNQIDAIQILNGSPTIKGCIITTSATSSPPDWSAAIGIYGGSPLIKDNKIFGSKGMGIIIRNAKPIIQNNIIEKNGIYGVWFTNNSEGLLTNNTIINNQKSGIGIKSRANPIIKNNKICNNGENGIFVYADGNGTIEDNKLEFNGYNGIQVDLGGKVLKISGNTIANNSRHGLHVTGKGSEAKVGENSYISNKFGSEKSENGGKINKI